ncbi:hypothetical protein EV715DRAFT_250159 [Schizophyllum commune]
MSVPARLRSNATPTQSPQLSPTIPAGLRGKLGGMLESRPYNVCLERRLASLTILQPFIFPIHPKPFSELPSSPSPPSLTPPVHKACPPKPLWQFASSLPCSSHVRTAYTGGMRRREALSRSRNVADPELILRVFALVISRMLVIVQQLLAHRVISGVRQRAWPRFRSSNKRGASPDIARYRNPSCQCQASPALTHCFMIYVTTRATRTPVPSASSCRGAALCSARDARDSAHLPRIYARQASRSSTAFFAGRPYAWTHSGSPCRHSKSIYPQRFVVQGLEERTRLTIPSQDMHPLVF